MWLAWQEELHPKKHRLVCFGHAGATYSDFSVLKSALTPDIHVIAVSLPGRSVRISEPPIVDMATIADAVAESICELPSAVTTLFGHSLGGNLAYMTARALGRNRYRDLNAVIVSASSTSKSTVLENIDPLNTHELHSALIKKGYLDRSVQDNPKLMDLVLPYLLADVRCKESWPTAMCTTIEQPIHTLAWLDDSFIRPAALSNWKNKTAVPHQSKTKLLEGGHLTYKNAPISLVRTLRKWATGTVIPITTEGAREVDYEL